MIVEEKKKPKFDEIPQNQQNKEDINIKEEKKEAEKVKRKIHLIRLRDEDLRNQERGIPALNAHFKKHHVNVDQMKSNRDRISRKKCNLRISAEIDQNLGE